MVVEGGSSMDIADTRMKECNDLCGGLYNSVEAGNKRGELASGGVVAQCVSKFVTQMQ